MVRNLNWPTIENTDPLGEALKGFQEWRDYGRGIKFDQEAPKLFEQAAGPLSEYGLTTPPDQLREMFRNPQTRDLAIAQVREAEGRRADATDPVKILQRKKMEWDLAKAQRDANAPAAPPKPIEVNGQLIDPTTYKVLGDYRTAPDAPKPLTDVAKLKSDLDAGLITEEQYKAAVAKELQANNGLNVTTNPDGTVSVQQGGPAGATMPKLTEGQSKDVVYLTKGAGALPALDQFGDSLTSLPETVGGMAPLVGNYAKSEGFQQAEQAGKEFLAAVLRKDTGAAVTKSEEDMYGAMYLPRPGDKPALLAQKKAARVRALKAIELGIPSAAILSMEQQGVALPGREQPAEEGWTDVGNGVRIREIK